MAPTARLSLLSIPLVVALGSGTPAIAQHHNKHDDRVLKEDPRLAEGQLAPVLEGLGDHHHEVTTDSDGAQRFFDQGLKLTYGFNHQEALRSFKEAARLDPDCAMAYWGWALVLGPNLNLPMFPEVVEQAYEAAQQAVKLKDGVSEKERALIEALALRYLNDPEADRAPLNRAYADAMAKAHLNFPEDNDVATLYAAGLMNLTPWNYWTHDGQPKGDTQTVLDVLEGVIERDQHHEGALHYYIHIVESVDARRGEKAADLLRGLAPGAGHLVHMPSHIYMQTGRYAESFEDNTLAAQADENYITQCRAQGLYPLTYYPHNVHFVAWAAAMQGRSSAALEESRKVAARVPTDLEHNVWGLYQIFLGMPLETMVRFGEWEQVLNEPKPPKNLAYVRGLWRFARGMAYVHTDEAKKARKELLALAKIADDPDTDGTGVGFTNIGRLLGIARAMLTGEIDATEGRYDAAIGHLTRATLLEDGMLYNEPPDWIVPVRHTLGAVLLEAGYPEEAETVYWQDLSKRQENGYSLYGLWKSLVAQGRTQEAAEILERFEAAWADADTALTSSRF